MGGNVVLHIPAFFIFVTAMYPFLNIHTHRPDARGGVCPVLCAEPSDFLRGADSAALYSVGHHPWRVGSQSRAELATMAQLLLQKQVVAVGEIGLDKVCDADFRLQQEFFKFQLRMAACVRKPVVVHCVKAWSELLETLSQVEDLPPVVIHGFRGKPQLAEQLLRHGCFLSFGPKFNADTLKSVPLGSLFLETDDDDADIVALYGYTAELLGLGLEQLKQAIAETWQRFFADSSGAALAR